jgi:hypothetical protein
MKTYAEMTARYAEREAARLAAFEERAQLIKTEWVKELERCIDTAFESEAPVECVSVSSNRLDSSMLPKIEGATTCAAELVRGHFLNLGFDADTPPTYIAADRVRVTIRWA